MYKQLVMALFFLSVVSLAYAGLDEGKASYDKGDYGKAFKEFKALAERGDVKAQVALGLMYGKGKGVAKDDAEAAKWIRKAADQGEPDAQHILGLLYYNGQGVPQDYVHAYMWLNLSAAQGYSKAQTTRDELAEKMTPTQIAEAQRLAKEWKPKGKH